MKSKFLQVNTPKHQSASFGVGYGYIPNNVNITSLLYPNN